MRTKIAIFSVFFLTIFFKSTDYSRHDLLASNIFNCTQPLPISRFSNDEFALIPEVVVDSYGNMHLTWSGVPESRYPDTDAIFYMEFDGKYWSNSVDILASQSRAVINKLLYTDDDHLLISWRFQDPQGDGLRVSYAPLNLAGKPQEWHTQTLLSNSIMDSDMHQSADGRIHLGAIIHEPAINIGYIAYSWSDDSGKTWSPPVEITQHDPNEVAPRFLTVYANDAGMAHFAWSVSTREDGWNPIGIWYTAYDTAAQFSDTPTEVFPGPRANMPSFLIGADERIYLTWMRGVGYGDSKYAMLSNDAGENWSPPQLIIEEMRGLNGPMKMALDSLDNEYLIMSGDDPGGATRIWISQRIDDMAWSQPIEISGPDLRQSEYPKPVIRNGNQLHIFWLDWGERQVFHVECVLDAPYTPANPVNIPMSIEEDRSEETTNEIANEGANLESGQNITDNVPNYSLQPPTGRDNEVGRLAIPIFSSLLLILVVFVWQKKR